ncbi:MAG: response regulator [Acidobacteriota bacterium]
MNQGSAHSFNQVPDQLRKEVEEALIETVGTVIPDAASQPIDSTERSPASWANTIREEPTEHSILVIDDEEVVLHSMQVYFTHIGYRVDVAATLEQAENFVVANEYDLVITDLRLTRAAGHEGLSLVRFLRQTSPATATVVLTAYGSPEIEKEAQSLGVDRFLQKPVPLLTLARHISLMLAQRRRVEM